jgi:hypothetical protein
MALAAVPLPDPADPVSESMSPSVVNRGTTPLLGKFEWQQGVNVVNASWNSNDNLSAYLPRRANFTFLHVIFCSVQ